MTSSVAGLAGAKIGLALQAGCMGGSFSAGTSGRAVSEAAAECSTINANSALQRCSEPFGGLSVDDGREERWWGELHAQTKATTVEPLILTIVQQSGCFVIAAIGNQRLEGRMSRITDRQRNSGECRAGSRQQMGRSVTADCLREPAIMIDNAAVGGVGGAVGAAVGGLVGALETKSPVVTPSLFKSRSLAPISAAQGSSTAASFGAALAAFGGGVGGGRGGLSTTPEG
jgi:hypothetical protein